MIVKNEAHVIARCLESVRSYISAWVIVDTGSSDGTQDLIKSLLKDIPGQLYERNWVDFASNRNEAIELALQTPENNADYLLFLDADEEIICHNPNAFKSLSEDRYMLWLKAGSSSTNFRLDKLLHRRSQCRYQGVLHEALYCPQSYTAPVIDEILVKGHFDSARNQQDLRQKYLKDAKVLEKALQSPGPHLERYTFYLAQSYFDAGEYTLSLKYYQQRISQGAWEEEVWYSYYRCAIISEYQGKIDRAICYYLDAYQYRPQRREALCRLAALYRTQEKYQLAYLFAKNAQNSPEQQDILFIDQDVYDWRLDDEVAISAYWIGQYQEALALNQALLANPKVPTHERARIEQNLNFCTSQVTKQ